jgi:hypothetical protein
MAHNPTVGSDSIAYDNKGVGVSHTLGLTKAFERGEISADDYVDRRAELVGRPNFVHGIVLPFIEVFRLNWRHKAMTE